MFWKLNRAPFSVLDLYSYSALNCSAMDTSAIIDRLGGNKAVIELTGLTKGRISQWRTENVIPRPWLMFFLEKDASIQELIDRDPAPKDEAAA